MGETFMNMPHCVLHTGIDSDFVLSKLGFTENDIRDALMSALYERCKSSKLHPKVDAGFRFWSEMVAALRRILIGKGNGWSSEVVNRMEMVVNSSKGVNLIITSGDGHTGRPDGLPKTKNAKGEATRSIVHNNPGTFDMFQADTLHSGKAEITPIDSTRTYIVLYYYDAANKEIRCEVSYPVGMVNQDGFARVSAWSERIILAPLQFEGADIFPEQDFDDDISISVESK
ncbi:hypothetical protein [Escherichia coli]|uniref:hypothetical protein n=1 Tax=Escherichia coli TaxID=562 RepID=UPI001FCEC351|nr:hypothetical protein [Escherichia coli]MCZ0573030.1 hypothetical protein [Escherichia coli]MCZ0606236.1 hypothetical protein [Escherichia coli]MEB6702856.1 hypothetical protein [Escherichia coli]MEB6722178.1 hypothetical protein [Escherichia coli]